MVLLISYDLNGHERPSAYAAVKEKIEGKANAWIRPLYSQWFVDTSASVQEWSDYLIDGQTIDQGDKLFILQVRRPYQGWLKQEHWDWLNARI